LGIIERCILQDRTLYDLVKLLFLCSYPGKRTPRTSLLYIAKN
jgi:hypothetical protein